MRYALFLGCTVPVRARNYELSTRKVAEALGIELTDVDDFACCGFPIKSLDRGTALLLASRNLAVAENLGLDICVLCSACASFLTETNKDLQKDSQLRAEVNKKLSGVDRSYKGGVEVKHFARVLYEDIGVEKIRNSMKKNLTSLKIAAHYGCHYLKPSEIYGNFDDPEHPFSLDKLISVTGATSVEYEDKKQCCGGAILGMNENIALTMSSNKLDHIKSVGADAICLICPFCGVMYDNNQRRIEKKFNVDYGLPVLYYPQLLGLALGLNQGELGLNMNRVKTSSLLIKV
ncbi:MAG: hypothetical protein GTO54_02080 [Nitrososphaeria archaeon]|nr:hypothetical protein [Nitrososphaeria archaeon]